MMADLLHPGLIPVAFQNERIIEIIENPMCILVKVASEKVCVEPEIRNYQKSEVNIFNQALLKASLGIPNVEFEYGIELFYLIFRQFGNFIKGKELERANKKTFF